jgi:sorbitol/mannitol transport system permease protein
LPICGAPSGPTRVWLSDARCSIILIVSWQWLPFATLILLTAIQSLDSEQLEAAEMDGAPPLSRFFFIILPHLSRAITIVILIQTIFLLSIFAEIFVTTGGAFGTRTLTYLIFQRVLESQNVGLGSAGGVYAIILANIVALFLMRIVGKNLDA